MDISIAPAFSAAFALASAIAAGASLVVGRRNLTAKFLDRVYELDKLAMTKPCLFEKYAELGKRRTDDYFAKTPLSAEYFEVKGLAYFYLNLFEELYHAHRYDEPGMNEDWAAWLDWIYGRMRHPLVRELFITDCSVTIANGRAAPRGRSVYASGFVKYLCDHYDQWRGEPDLRSL